MRLRRSSSNPPWAASSNISCSSLTSCSIWKKMSLSIMVVSSSAGHYSIFCCCCSILLPVCIFYLIPDYTVWKSQCLLYRRVFYHEGLTAAEGNRIRVNHASGRIPLHLLEIVAVCSGMLQSLVFRHVKCY